MSLESEAQSYLDAWVEGGPGRALESINRSDGTALIRIINPKSPRASKQLGIIQARSFALARVLAAEWLKEE